MQSTQDTDLPVKHWSEEQLEAWAGNNITTGTLPKPDWHQRQVAIWARKVLNFAEISAKYLCELGVDGQALLAFNKIEDLFEDFAKEMQTERTLKTSLRKLWVQIEKLRSIEEQREKPQQGKKRKHSETFAADSDEETLKLKKQKLDPRRNYAPHAKPAVNQALAWVERNADLTRIQEVFARNQGALAFRPTTIAIGGPCGIGKTRLALQFIKNSGFDITLWADVPPRCEDVNELLKSQLGFNGVHFSDNFKAFINKKLENKDENTRLKCVIYLDEIQHLDFNELLKLRYAICSTCAERNGRIVIQLIISGVQTAFLRASFADDEWTNLQSNGGIVLINLQPLSTTESSQLLEDVLTAVHKKSNAKQIVNQPFVIESLKWMGGNPRLIEFLAAKLAKSDLTNCNAEWLLKAVEKVYWSLHSDRLGRPDSYYKLITSACLARVQLRLGDTLSDGTNVITVKQLIYEGSVVWTQIDDKALGTKEAKGYLSLPLAVIRWYITQPNIRNTFSLKLFTPDLHWQWEDFQHFTAELVALRLRAYWMCGYKSINLKSFFENIPMSPQTQEHEIPLGPFNVRQLESHCESASDVTSVLTRQYVSPIEKYIENADDENKEIAETLLQKTKAEMDFLVVRNASLAPSWDAAVYVKNKLVLAIQTKHTERIDDPSKATVTKKTITDEQSKVSATVPLLFITNRPIQVDAQNLAVTRSRLIIVHRDNLSTMLGAFGNLW